MRQSLSTLLFVAWVLGTVPPTCVADELGETFYVTPPPPSTPSGGRTNAMTAPPEKMPNPITPISSVGTNIAPTAGRLPTDFAAAEFPTQPVAPPHHVADGVPRSFCWAAPGTCHRPLYFENPSLERHGYSLGLAQPFASAAHFVGNTAILPYRLVAEPTRDCVYSLGDERPGSPTTLHYYRPRFSIAGGLAEAGVATGLVFLLP